mgnify:CR=1 FL=1
MAFLGKGLSLIGKKLLTVGAEGGVEAAEQIVKRSKKAATVSTGIDPRMLGLKNLSDNTRAFYTETIDPISAKNLQTWQQIGPLTHNGKDLGTIDSFNEQVVRAIEDGDEDAYMNVLGILDGVDLEIPRYNYAQQQLTVSSNLRSPSMTGVDPVAQQQMIRGDKGKVQEVAKKTPSKAQAGQLASAKANVTIEPLSENPNIFMSGSQEIKKRTPREIGPEDATDLIPGFPGEKIQKKQQHHELIKALFSAYIERARQLGTELDVANLGWLARDKDFDLGDKLKAMFFADKLPHDAAHRWAINEGVQPDASGMRGLDTELEAINSINDIDTLTADFNQAIKEIGIPMREEMKHFQDAWDAIPVEDRLELIRLRTVRKYAGKKGSKAYEEANKVYKAFKEELEEQMQTGAAQRSYDAAETRAASEDVRIDEFHRQLGGGL